MTQDEVIEMAIEVYGSVHADDIKFAKLVAGAAAFKEREKCWMAVVQVAKSNGNAYDCIDAILDLESKS
jgi:hypothetical protein